MLDQRRIWWTNIKSTLLCYFYYEEHQEFSVHDIHWRHYTLHPSEPFWALYSQERSMHVLGVTMTPRLLTSDKAEKCTSGFEFTAERNEPPLEATYAITQHKICATSAQRLRHWVLVSIRSSLIWSYRRSVFHSRRYKSPWPRPHTRGHTANGEARLNNIQLRYYY